MRRASRAKPRWLPAAVATAAVAVIYVIFSLGRYWEASSLPHSHNVPRNALERSWAFQGGEVDTLVTYIFSDTDPEYRENLRFFLRWGIREGDGADYIIVLQESENAKVTHNC